MSTLRRGWCGSAVMLAAWFCWMGLVPESGNVHGWEKPASGQKISAADLERLLEDARHELQAADLSEKEIRLRLKIVENVATVKSYFPHVIGGPPETRNSKYWVENDEGSYVPRGKPTEAIKDLWRTTSGIRCHKLSTLVMLKGVIDVADAREIAHLDEMLRGKVIPNDLPDEGIGTLFEHPDPKEGEVFQASELLPGDEVWFDNPYFERLSEKNQSNYRGQEGHHVFYIGGEKVMDMYGREPESIEDFRHTFLRWGSVKIASKKEGHSPQADEFQIKSVRRVIVKQKSRD